MAILDTVTYGSKGVLKVRTSFTRQPDRTTLSPDKTLCYTHTERSHILAPARGYLSRLMKSWTLIDIDSVEVSNEVVRVLRYKWRSKRASEWRWFVNVSVSLPLQNSGSSCSPSLSAISPPFSYRSTFSWRLRPTNSVTKGVLSTVIVSSYFSACRWKRRNKDSTLR